MKVNLTQAITDLDGKDFTDGSTVKTAIIGALLNPLKGDENLAGAQKDKLFCLAMSVHAATEIDLPAEDVATIKERVGRGYAPLIVGRVWAAIDPKAA